MKKLFVIAAAALAMAAAAPKASAQQVTEVYADSLVYTPAASVDSTLLGKNVFKVLTDANAKGKVTVHQSGDIANAFSSRVKKNASRTINGYRVRIFFDNKQGARNASMAVRSGFVARHPGISAYWTFTSPFFKVTVGDFRTKSEAMKLLKQIKGEYPTAFLVKEKIEYPAADRTHTYDVDTLTVVRAAN